MSLAGRHHGDMKFRHFTSESGIQHHILCATGSCAATSVAQRRYEQTSYPLAGDLSYWHQLEMST
jgi:hypothetical protein